MTYTPRRLRRRPSPQWLLRVPHTLTPEQALLIRQQWIKAQQRHPAIVVSNSIEVVRLR